MQLYIFFGRNLDPGFPNGEILIQLITDWIRNLC